jgi:hypothetical protein
MTFSVLQQPGSISADSVRAVVGTVMSRAEFEWREVPAVLERLAEAWRWLMSWLGGLSQLHPVAYWLLIAGSLLVLIAIFAHVGWTLKRAFRRPERGGSPEEAPTVVPRDAGWHREEATRLREAGRLIESLAHYFMALLLELDRREVVRFHPSKTPREYIEEVELEPVGRAAFAELVARLYAHAFGGVVCTEAELDAFARRAEELGGWVAAR